MRTLAKWLDIAEVSQLMTILSSFDKFIYHHASNNQDQKSFSSNWKYHSAGHLALTWSLFLKI